MTASRRVSDQPKLSVRPYIRPRFHKATIILSQTPSNHPIRNMPRAMAGVLVECDPSIKAIIDKINAEHGHDIIIESIDDEHVLIKSAKEDELKRLLKEALKDTVKEAEESTDED